MNKWGAPYRGSKGKRADRIFSTMESERQRVGLPNILVDPFCGGFAISHKFISEGWKVRCLGQGKHYVLPSTKCFY